MFQIYNQEREPSYTVWGLLKGPLRRLNSARHAFPVASSKPECKRAQCFCSIIRELERFKSFTRVMSPK